LLELNMRTWSSFQATSAQRTLHRWTVVEDSASRLEEWFHFRSVPVTVPADAASLNELHFFSDLAFFAGQVVRFVIGKHYHDCTSLAEPFGH
jgi:hypothetical protein